MVGIIIPKYVLIEIELYDTLLSTLVLCLFKLDGSNSIEYLSIISLYVIIGPFVNLLTSLLILINQFINIFLFESSFGPSGNFSKWLEKLYLHFSQGKTFPMDSKNYLVFILSSNDGL